MPACQHHFLLKGQPREETPVLTRTSCCPTDRRCPQPRTCGELRNVLSVAIQAGLLHGIDGVPQEFVCILLVPEPEVPGNFCRKKGMQEGDDCGKPLLQKPTHCATVPWLIPGSQWAQPYCQLTGKQGVLTVQAAGCSEGPHHTPRQLLQPARLHFKHSPPPG